jgi:hypothetical protein
MTRDRFSEINDSLHPDISFLMTDLRNKNKQYWKPFRDMSIDETIYPFKGKVRFRQRIPAKPHSTGLKYFILADSTGFIYDAFLYKGKETEEIEVKGKQDDTKVTRDESQTVKIVDYFVSKLDDTHIIYMDKYYGSIAVMECLTKNAQGGVVQCQANRPSEIFSQHLNLGLSLKTF